MYVQYRSGKKVKSSKKQQDINTVMKTTHHSLFACSEASKKLNVV
jgi:hypothetical protein